MANQDTFELGMDPTKLVAALTTVSNNWKKVEASVRATWKEQEHAKASFGKMNQTMGQLTFAADDFLTVLSGGGGLNRALLSASNNLSAVLVPLGAMYGLIPILTTMGVTMVSQFLKPAKEETKELADSTNEAADAVKRLARESEEARLGRSEAAFQEKQQADRDTVGKLKAEVADIKNQKEAAVKAKISEIFRSGGADGATDAEIAAQAQEEVGQDFDRKILDKEQLQSQIEEGMKQRETRHDAETAKASANRRIGPVRSKLEDIAAGMLGSGQDAASVNAEIEKTVQAAGIDAAQSRGITDEILQRGQERASLDSLNIDKKTKSPAQQRLEDLRLDKKQEELDKPVRGRKESETDKAIRDLERQLLDEERAKRQREGDQDATRKEQLQVAKEQLEALKALLTKGKIPIPNANN